MKDWIGSSSMEAQMKERAVNWREEVAIWTFYSRIDWLTKSRM